MYFLLFWIPVTWCATWSRYIDNIRTLSQIRTGFTLFTMDNLSSKSDITLLFSFKGIRNSLGIWLFGQEITTSLLPSICHWWGYQRKHGLQLKPFIMVHQERLLPCLVTDLLSPLITNATKSIRKQPRENLGYSWGLSYIGLRSGCMFLCQAFFHWADVWVQWTLVPLLSCSQYLHLTNPCTTNGHSPESTPLSLSSFTGNDSCYHASHFLMTTWNQ